MPSVDKSDSLIPMVRPYVSGSKTLVVPVKVGFRDLDAMGHVNNASYFTLLEMARLEFYRHFLKARRLEDLDMIAVEAKCRFLSQALWGEVLLVQVWVSRVGHTSFDFQYEVNEQRSGRPVAWGETVQVSWNYQMGLKKPVPDRLRKLCVGTEI